MRAATLSGREAELAAGLEALRAELGPLTLDLGADGGAPAERARKLEEELGEIEAGPDRRRRRASPAPAPTDAAESAREAALGAVRSGAERASRHARRAEGLLGERHREALRKRARRRRGAARRRAAPPPPRSTAVEAAIRARVERTEGRVVGGEGDGDEIAEEMRACSQRESELQVEMKAASDELTAAEVEAAHLGDRRAEAAKELASIAERLGEEVAPAEEALSDEERAEIDRRLERLERRRAQIGPVNPLAEQRVRGGARARRGAAGPARGHRARDARAGGADPRHRPRDRARLRGDLRGDRQELRGDGRAPLPGRARRPAPGQPAPGPRRGAPGGEQEAPTDADEPEPEEEEEREELGVEIEVTPAGKSTRKLSLLSGGEKSLVALAFVFAVFLARPCPFYILDEVEAALDDANIDRFLQLVRRFSDRAQFVIVTHQKRTMDAADVLYGVTMGDDGVTKVVSRRLPREDASAEARPRAPPPFAGIAAETSAEEAAGGSASPPSSVRRRLSGSVEAA